MFRAYKTKTEASSPKTWTHKIWDGFLYCLKGYILAVMAVFVLQRYLMYAPTDRLYYTPEETGVEVVAYKTIDGLTLQSWYAAPETADHPVIVMFHGNAGNVSMRGAKIKFFTDQGYGFLAAEYRGYGPNTGAPSEEALYTDARAALHWLITEKNIPQTRIALYGESLGTGVAAQMALEFPHVRALVLEAPFTSIPDVTKGVYFWLGPFRHMAMDTYESWRKVPYFTMPTLIIHGAKDKIVSPHLSQILIEGVGARNKKRIVFDEAGHNDLHLHGGMGAVLMFLQNL